MTNPKQTVELDNEHTFIFSFYAMWLNHEALIPFKDLSKPLRKAKTKKKRSDVAVQDSAPIPISMSTTRQLVNIAQMSQVVPDPEEMSLGRLLVEAFFLGQHLGAPHFQDAVMNAIVQSFAPDKPPTTEFVSEVYRRSMTGSQGLKKLLVDYYIWGCFDGPRQNVPTICQVTNTQAFEILDLDMYHHAFIDDVNSTYQELMASNDVTVNFMDAEEFLIHCHEARFRCRYHHHTTEELCFNLMVDKKGINQ